MKLVLDTNVLVAAALSRRGASAWIVRRVLVGRILAAASVPLFVEYEAVLKRPEHVKRTGWKPADVDLFLGVLAAAVERTTIRFLWRPGAVDPKDEMLVECAVASQADLFVTFNVRHVLEAGRRFRFRVVTPAQAFGRLRRAGIR